MDIEKKIQEWDQIHCEKHVTGLVHNISNIINKHKFEKINIIDIGANVGKVYELMKNLVNVENVWMFEASELLFNYTKKKFNDDGKVRVYHTAVNNNEELIDFDESSMILQIEGNEGELNFGLSQIKETQYSKKVKSTMISKFFDEEKFIYQDFCFIKIDTETVDFNILKDLSTIIRKFKIKPLIEFEINYFTIGLSPDEAQSIIDTFIDLGYQKLNLKECQGDGILIPLNFKPLSNMIYKDKITKKSNLDENDSLCIYKNEWAAQQNYKAFETFYYFLKEVKPKRILEIGTSLGGFTTFIKESCNELNIECEILSYDILDYPYYDKMREMGIDVRTENVFDPYYESVSQSVIDFIQSDGITIVLCDGGNKKLEFNLLSNYLKENDFILGHDYSVDHEYFVTNIDKKIWNWCELVEKDITEACNKNNLVDYRRDLFQSVVWVCKMKSNNTTELEILNMSEELILPPIDESINSKTTFVTGLWNIKRDSLTEGWSRSYEHYLSNFAELLKTDVNMIIYGDEELESFVKERRNERNTQFVRRNIDWFKSSVPFEKIQEIRTNPQWYGQSGWLPDSTQGKLEWYNPLVMSKMFLLHDAKILDKFDSEEMYWIDAGLANTVHSGYFTHDKVQNKLKKYFNKFSFVCFPYEASNEIHGFSYPQINEYAGDNVNLVGRGGFFGGPKESISEVNSMYYSMLVNTLNDGYMGTEESIFSILVYQYSNLINYFQIEDNGLMGKFFEDLKNDTLEVKTKYTLPNGEPVKDINKTSLYVIGFNSPNQLSTLIKSMIEYDEDFIKKPKKYLLNNSTDRSTDSAYEELCGMYDFEIINPGENLGICGGRQFIAEHFEKTDSEFMFFFEDDMFFYPKQGEVCRNGFNRFVNNLYDKSLRIIQTENFDFLKLNFSEFFGDNSVQWSWYNVPQQVREEYWPKHTKLPVMGLDPNAPRTVFKNVKSLDGVPYADGEIYYCNWPQVISKKGNYKMFLDTKWAHPYEQTWMSFMYQETKKGNLNGALLLMTPTEHNRFEHYEAGLRRES